MAGRLLFSLFSFITKFTTTFNVSTLCWYLEFGLSGEFWLTAGCFVCVSSIITTTTLLLFTQFVFRIVFFLLSLVLLAPSNSIWWFVLFKYRRNIYFAARAKKISVSEVRSLLKVLCSLQNKVSYWKKIFVQKQTQHIKKHHRKIIKTSPSALARHTKRQRRATTATMELWRRAKSKCDCGVSVKRSMWRPSSYTIGIKEFFRGIFLLLLLFFIAVFCVRLDGDARLGRERWMLPVAGWKHHGNFSYHVLPLTNCQPKEQMCRLLLLRCGVKRSDYDEIENC